MKRLFIFIILVTSATVFTAFAQPNPACGGPGGCGMGPCHDGARHSAMGARNDMPRGGHMMRDGVPSTVTGRVVSIEQGMHGGRGGGLIVNVESDSRVIPVHLGPGWRHEGISDQIKKNDRIEINGMKVTRHGQTHVMAKDIKLNDNETLTLRSPEDRREMRQDMRGKMRMKDKRKAY